MFRSTHWFNVFFVLALLLGMFPAAGSNAAPAAALPPEDARALQPAASGPAATGFGPPAPIRPTGKTPAAPSAIPNDVPDNRGREFWLTFPMNHDGIDNTLQLFITSHVNTTGTVSIPGLSFSEAFTVTAGQITTVALPAGAEITVSDEVQDNGIRVTAGEEVSVYGLTFDEEVGVGVTADAYLGLPTDVLGTAYLVLGYETDGAVDVPGSQFALVGTQNGTTVVITPTADTWNGTIGRFTGESYQITLNQGQTYLLYADGFGGDDLTGTPIHADKPLAVFGGNRCANVPTGYEACDTVVEQLPPTTAWGKEFAAVPLASRSNGDTFRILAAQDDTSLWINGTEVPAALARGAFYEEVLTTRSHITATKPVLVAQYSNGQTYDSTRSDPFMMLIPPFEQFQGAYVVNTPASGFPRNYLNVVAPSHVITDVFLDGAPITTTLFQPIGTSRFSGAQVSVTLGTHQLTGTLPFGVFAYGFVDYGSYGYPGGGALGPIADVATITLTLSPGGIFYVGTHYCVTATVRDAGSSPVAGVRIDFDITGEHPQQTFGVSNAQGEVPVCYTGTQVGIDTAVASIGTLSANALIQWIEAGETYTLTIAKTGTGDGIVTPTVGAHTYVSGTTVALGATPYPTSTFDGWSGDSDCLDASVTMTANKACTATFTLGAVTPALAIAKTAKELSDPPLVVNDQILYTIHVTNTNAITLTTLVVTDTLPAGVAFYNVPKGSSRPFTRNGEQVIWERAELAPGASLTFQVIVKVSGLVDPIECNYADADSTETLPVQAGPICLGTGDIDTGLELLKTATDVNGAPLYVNDLVRYDIRITNTHPVSTMTDLVITETVPAGLVFESADPPGQGTNPVTWTHASLIPGGVWTATVLLRVDGSADPIGSNVVTVTSRQQSETATDPVPPPPGPDKLVISKTATEMSDAPLLVNDQILYTIRVTNTTTGTLTTLVITDTLPDGVAFYNVPKGPSRPFTRDGQQVIWTRASLAAGESLTFQVVGKVDGSANPIGENQVVATCAEEAIPAAAGAQVAGDGTHEPGLVVIGTVNGGTLRAQVARAGVLAVGDRLTYTLTVTNANLTHTMHNVIISATLPSGATFLSATPAGYTGVTTLTWTLAELGPGAEWQGSLTVEQTGPLGELTLEAASDEQSPVEAIIAPPGGAGYRVYMPLALR